MKSLNKEGFFIIKVEYNKIVKQYSKIRKKRTNLALFYFSVVLYVESNKKSIMHIYVIYQWFFFKACEYCNCFDRSKALLCQETQMKEGSLHLLVSCYKVNCDFKKGFDILITKKKRIMIIFI